MNHPPEMLGADRKRLMKEHLMHEIARQPAAAAPPRRRRRGWLVAPPLVVGLAAAVAVLSTTQPTGRPGAAPDPAAAPTAPPSASSLRPCSADAPPTGSAAPTTSPGSTGPSQVAAAISLAAAADAAATEPGPQVRDDQFFYLETLQQVGDQQPCLRRDWIAADGNTPGLIIDPGKSTPMTFVPNAGNLPPSLHSPNYRYLAELPTDPQLLLERVYADNPKDSPDRDSVAFRTIWGLFGTAMLTPAVRGGLCRAVATVPGVTLEIDTVDAAGRHGIGVVRADSEDRIELVLDPENCQLLGVRDTRLAAIEGGAPAGSVHTTAVVRRAVTDRAGEAPPADPGTGRAVGH